MHRDDLHAELAGDWLVVAIGDDPVDPAAPRTVSFGDGRVAGQVGVNRFTASYTLNEGALEVGPVASTRMAGPPELMALEDRFASFLAGDHRILVEGNDLVVGRGDQRIRLTRAPRTAVRGTVSYRERMMLPPGSVIIVELVDISGVAASGGPVASQVIEGAFGPPVPFSLSTEVALDKKSRYAVQARIVSDKVQPLWTGESLVEVPNDDEPLELILRKGE